MGGKRNPAAVYGVFQEAFRLFKLEPRLLQTLLAAAYPRYEIRTSEMEARWRTRRRSLFKRLPKAEYRSIYSLTEKQKEAEMAKKEKLEKIFSHFGRKDITTPLHNPDDDGISSSRLYQVVNPAPNFAPDHKNDYIGVHIIKVGLADGQKWTVVAVMDSPTFITALRLHEMPDGAAVAEEVARFVQEMEKIRITRDAVRFVRAGVRETRPIIKKARQILHKKPYQLKTLLDPACRFKEIHPIEFGMNAEAFRAAMRRAVVDFNVGKFRMRPPPYLHLKRLLKNRELPDNQKAVLSAFEDILGNGIARDG